MTTKAKKSVLPQVETKVRYKYIPRRYGDIRNKNHLLYDGKVDGSIDKFSVLRNERGQFSLGITEIERKELESVLQLNEGDLFTGTMHNDYLSNFQVEVPKDGLRLDISNPHDFLIDKVLQAYNNVFAPDIQSQKKKRSYRYVRVAANDETDMILELADTRKEAYKLLGALEESREKMIMYLLYTGSRVHPSIGIKDLRKLVNTKVERSYDDFLKAVKDELFVAKGTIRMAEIVGAVTNTNGLYYFESQALAHDGKPATLDNAAIFLEDNDNADIKVAISTRTLDDFNANK